jgi:predicted RNA-binding protein with RPS1 domain
MPFMCDAAEPAAEAPAEAAAADGEAEAPARRARAPRGPKTKLEELVTDVEMQGTVRSVQSYGAFVDIGAETDGLLHVSEISNDYVKDATEVLNVGDAVTVRVKLVNMEKKQVALTAKDPNAAPSPRPERSGGGGRGPKDLSEFIGADEKAYITGTVSRIQEYGAFIQLKDGIDGLVHISELVEGGVGAVSDVLKEGQEIQVRVIKVDTDSGRIGLSMKPWLAEEDRPKRKPRGDGGGGGGGMDGDDSAFQLTAEELEGVQGGDEDEVNSFEQAFARMTFESESKQSKKKFSRQML